MNAKAKLFVTLLLINLLINGCKNNNSIDNLNEKYQYQGNPGHTGQFFVKNFPTFKLVWKKKLNLKNGFITSPVCDKNSIFVAHDNEILALDYKGRTIWKKILNQSVTFSPITPAIYKELLFLGNQQGNFYAINVKTGKILWKKYFKREINFVSVYKGRIYFSTNNYVYVANYINGKQFWKRRIYLTGLVFGCGNFYLSDKKFLYCFNAKTNLLNWIIRNNGYVRVFNKGNIYTIFNSTLTAIEGKTGKILWKRIIDMNIENLITNISANEQSIFIKNDSSNLIYSYNHLGKKLWSKSTIPSSFPPILITGHLLIETSDVVKEISIINNKTGKFKKKIKIPSTVKSNPFITNKGNLLIVSGNNLLFYK